MCVKGLLALLGAGAVGGDRSAAARRGALDRDARSYGGRVRDTRCCHRSPQRTGRSVCPAR